MIIMRAGEIFRPTAMCVASAAAAKWSSLVPAIFYTLPPVVALVMVPLVILVIDLAPQEGSSAAVFSLRLTSSRFWSAKWK